ncbi:MAG: stage II sporulation protein M [Desulfobacteraceae bacterium]|nr:stage II sporulation protein M [Desulfobacteraceae bacterium]
MIIDLNKFINDEKKYWTELEQTLDAIEMNPAGNMELEKVLRFHYLYQRASADLAKIMTFSGEQQIKRYLESLVGRSFAEIHETREKPHRFAPLKWFFITFPQTFRRHIRAFWLAVLVFMAGFVFGGLSLTFDPEAKEILLPFSHLHGAPSDRVSSEEAVVKDQQKGRKSTFSSSLMTHNTKVSIFAMALGMTWGIGTIILLFINGIILGAVSLDYMAAGETSFLVGWLLPHGSIEIPAILIASQAGLVLAGALIGWRKPLSMRARLRKISSDLVTLIFGVAVMLVWAGFIEAFLSQYHEPVIPYEIKIGFGLVEVFLLVMFLAKSGRGLMIDD